MTRGRLTGVMGGLVLGLALAGCAKQHDHMASQHAEHMRMMQTMTDAIAVMHPTQGNKASGVVRFTRDGDNAVKVVAHIEGLDPGSVHGFHIHEWGDCSSPDGSSAGSHFDPAHTGHHGKPEDAARHAGDMGNITANAQGVADVTLTLHGVTICGMNNPIMGRGVIVHAKPDDFSQPVGNAGSRIACGVIGLAKPQQGK